MYAFSSSEELQTFITLIYFISLLPQLIFWGGIAPYNLWKNKKQKKGTTPPVSIIIAARNEADNLPKLLSSLVNQDYSSFEIIVINDRSTDNTGKIIDQFIQKHNLIRKVEIQETDTNWSPKKYALTQGIAVAKYDNFLFIDGDCWVESDKWVATMAPYFLQYDILIGVGLYKKIEGSWVANMTQFETLSTAIQYSSFSNIGINYMAVGRNFGYTKNIFDNANGFQKHKSVLSGDDDLFVNQMSSKKNTVTIINSNALTYSLPEKDWKTWFRQKTRHVSASYHYKFSNKLILGTLSASHISVYFIYLLMIPLEMANLLQLSVLLLIRTLLIMVCFKKFTKMVGEKIKWWHIPILDLMLIAYQILIGVSSVISKRKTWI
ncbi:glycosyltransferase [Flammeovirga sp. EKP202]|uniref:glycosyltransferase n=1 Tax=Flammeovirga sp. EKP202 TaxID=2770592 RepID=UPI00165F39E6|nr:glycosyltransferase [Flammeovirga sp. EKP202]MBD0400230.1 glycosyltransferase [Flammeovirga sp. EKP202]